MRSELASFATSAEAVRDGVRDALAAREALRIVGRGGWLAAGRPVHAERELSLAALSGIVAYTPGDLTITVLAGTRLADVAEVVRAEGQLLALDPAGGDGGSVGATVATASAGALAHAFGTPRDNVLGVEFVTGEGSVVRGGGRVVKNVAGFDLTRLVTGAWGTLGVLTEVTLRLRAQPEADQTLAIALPRAALADWVARLRALPLAAYALELIDATLARTLGVADQPVVLARLAGNEPAVAAQAAALAALGDAASVSASVWDALRVAEPPGAATARLSAPPRDVAATWDAAATVVRAAGPAGFAHATLGRGVARVVLPEARPEAVGAAFRRLAFTGTRVFEQLPAALWPVLAPSPVSSDLARRTRAAFDPHRLLNPGILGESPAT